MAFSGNVINLLQNPDGDSFLVQREFSSAYGISLTKSGQVS
jgi:hypothetical protein